MIPDPELLAIAVAVCSSHCGYATPSITAVIETVVFVIGVRFPAESTFVILTYIVLLRTHDP